MSSIQKGVYIKKRMGRNVGVLKYRSVLVVWHCITLALFRGSFLVAQYTERLEPRNEAIVMLTYADSTFANVT